VGDRAGPTVTSINLTLLPRKTRASPASSSDAMGRPMAKRLGQRDAAGRLPPGSVASAGWPPPTASSRSRCDARRLHHSRDLMGGQEQPRVGGDQRQRLTDLQLMVTKLSTLRGGWYLTGREPPPQTSAIRTPRCARIRCSGRAPGPHGQGRPDVRRMPPRRDGSSCARRERGPTGGSAAC